MRLFFLYCLTLGFLQSVNAENGVAPIHMPTATAGERGAFDWNPTYTSNLPAFDSNNRAFFRRRAQNANDVPPFELEYFNASVLVRRSYETELLRHFPAGTVIQSTLGANGRRFTSGVFNSQNEYFTLIGVTLRTSSLARPENAWILLWTPNAGATWSSHVIVRESEFTQNRCPARFNYDGHCKFPTDVEMSRNYSPSPIAGNMPVILLYTQTGAMNVRDSDKFDQIGKLSLLILSRHNTTGPIISYRYVALADHIAEASKVLGIGSHSGGSSKVIRFNNKIYVAWVAGTTNASQGSPTVVAKYDISTRRLTKKIVAYSRPSNDSHNQPGMIMTSSGILHLITGAHGTVMRHTHTLQSGSIRNWSTPITMGSNEQTYISMIADSEDNIHAVYRRWENNTESNGDNSISGVLTYQKFDGTSWSEPKALVYPNISGYFIYYQHLNIDRRGNLYLSYTRWSTQMPYCRPGTNRKCETHLIPQFSRTALLRSGDGGVSWSLATDQEIKNGCVP